MGISGLLPLLKSIQKNCTLKKFAGQTIGIDAYGWLHRGTVACAIELALDKPTTKYVDFAMGRVRMLLDFGIIPYLVFDGDNLPSKAGTNKERRAKRDESKTLGLELYKAGKISQAHQELQKAADVTPYMARQLIEELKRHNIQYVVAPYEADAQLVYLEHCGIINAILSEDSDLLVFGAKRLLTKLNQYGECVEIERANFASCREVSLAGWTDAMFRRMAILSGCDYLPNINKMGLKTAYRFVRKYKDAEKLLRMIKFEGQFNMPVDYAQNFKNAEFTFLHHRVFCPIQQKLVFLTELGSGENEADLPFLGEDVDSDTAVGVACGDLDPKTKKPMIVKMPLTVSRPPLRDQRRQTLSSSADLKTKTSIDSFFKPQRQPLAELDPNSLTPSPSQQRLLRVHARASWEVRAISSAPQLRRTATSIIPSTNRGHTASTDRTTFLAKASTISTYQQPKRPRLCSETDERSTSREVKESPFFADRASATSPLSLKKARSKKARKSDFDVWSDDSVDGILLGLPEVQQVASPNPPDEATTGTKHGVNSYDEDQEDGLDKIIQSSAPKRSSRRAKDMSLQSNMSNNALDTKTAVSQCTSAISPQLETDEHEFFVDLCELHEAGEGEDLLKTFMCQSPSRRANALASITSSNKGEGDAASRSLIDQSPTKQSLEAQKTEVSPRTSKLTPLSNLDGICESYSEEHSEKKRALNIQKTFAYQAPSEQASALRSLNQSQGRKVEIGKAALSASEPTEYRRPGRSSLQILREQALKSNKPYSDCKPGTQMDDRRASEPSKPVEKKALVALVQSTRKGKGSEDLIVPDSEDDSGAEEPEKPTIDLRAYIFTTL